MHVNFARCYLCIIECLIYLNLPRLILGGTFGRRTYLQDIISNILSNTSDFAKSRTNTDQFYDDGYIISFENKSLIDACLKDSPEMLFMHDLPEDHIDVQEYGEENKTSSALVYASRICRTSGYGWGIKFVYESLTSVMAYLIEQGAGIGCNTVLQVLDLSKMSPQLFVGASDAFRSYTIGSNKHIYSYTDIISLYSD
jgi:hypothetical protein